MTLTAGTAALADDSRLSTDGTSVCWTVEQAAGAVYCVSANAVAQAPKVVYAGPNPGPVTVRAGTVFWMAADSANNAYTLAKGNPAVAGSRVQLYSEPISAGNQISHTCYDLTGNLTGSVLYVGCSSEASDHTTFVHELMTFTPMGSAASIAVIGLASDPAQTAHPRGIDTDSTQAYTAYGGSTDGTILKSSSTGLSYGKLVTSQNDPRLVSVDNGYVYWSVETPLAIRRSTTASAAAVNVATPSASVLGLVATATDVYWTEAGHSAVFVAPVATGAPITQHVMGVQGVDQPGRLIRDATALYWIDRTTGAVKKVALK